MPLVDEYECIVDDERQIILRFSAIASGAPIAVVTADEILVDTRLAPDIFDFVPPDGTRVIHVERSG
jgi:outer membrane lipoprotein-sorting protein